MGFSLSNYCTLADKADIDQYALAVYHSIDGVPQAVWNKQVLETNLLMQHGYLKLIETTQKDRMSFSYILVKKNDSVLGALYFQTLRFSAQDLMNYFPQGESRTGKFLWGIARAIARPLVNRLKAQLLVSGNIFMTGESGFYFNPRLEKPIRAGLLRKAVQELARRNSRIKAVVVSDLYEPKSVFDKDFTLCDFHELTLEPDMSIVLRDEWNTFDDYLVSLTSKYRVRAKKVFSLCKEAGVERRELSAEEIEQYEDRLFNLYQQVMRNADFKLGTFTKEYFRLQKQQLPGNYRLLAYFQGEEILSFISAFHFGKKMDVHYVGMDDERCKAIHLYQRMMYDMVAMGIEEKQWKLHFGRTAPEIKSTVGAIPAATYGYIKHLNPLINWLVIRPFTRRMKPKEYVYRNPFKDK